MIEQVPESIGSQGFGANVIDFAARNMDRENRQAEAAARQLIIEKYGFVRDPNEATAFERYQENKMWKQYEDLAERMSPARLEHEQRMAGKFRLTLIKP